MSKFQIILHRVKQLQIYVFIKKIIFIPDFETDAFKISNNIPQKDPSPTYRSYKPISMVGFSSNNTNTLTKSQANLK